MEHLIIKVILTAKNFSELIGLDNFMSLLNYFTSSVKYRLCTVMLDYFSREKGKFTDEYKIHTVLRIAKVLHDKVDALGDAEENAYISNQICKVIHKIDYG